MNTFDVLQNSPQLFDDPGHVYNNMVLQRKLFQKAATQTAIKHTKLINHTIEDRIQELKIINKKDMLKSTDNEIKGLNDNINQQTNENINHNGQKMLTPISGNSRQGKYCFRFDDIDTSEIIDPTGNNQNIVVEICFDKNPYAFE